MNRRLAFLLAVVAQLAFLGWMVAAQERVLRVGRRIVLAIEPVDPIDPLSGRHLAIRPKIARIDLAKLRSWADAETLERAATELSEREVSEVIVPLHEEAGEWVVTEVEDADSFQPDGGVVLRGRVRSHYGSTVVVEFGLERFFIPSDAADPSPLLWQGGHTLAIAVRVMADGRSSIEDLIVDGKPFHQWNAEQPKPK